jgi:hypothetical protein
VAAGSPDLGTVQGFSISLIAIGIRLRDQCSASNPSWYYRGDH